MKLFIKTTILGAALLALTACGIFGAGIKSPCAGLYCLDVTAAGIPGEALVCYDTNQQMLNAQKAYEIKGSKTTVAK
jgi:hypothetical protein